MVYGLSKSGNCDDLGCIYFKVIYRLQSFFQIIKQWMIRCCKISDKRVARSLFNNTTSRLFHTDRHWPLCQWWTRGAEVRWGGWCWLRWCHNASVCWRSPSSHDRERSDRTATGEVPYPEWTSSSRVNQLIKSELPDPRWSTSSRVK